MKRKEPYYNITFYRKAYYIHKPFIIENCPGSYLYATQKSSHPRFFVPDEKHESDFEQMNVRKQMIKPTVYIYNTKTTIPYSFLLTSILVDHLI